MKECATRSRARAPYCGADLVLGGDYAEGATRFIDHFVVIKSGDAQSFSAQVACAAGTSTPYRRGGTGRLPPNRGVMANNP